MQGSSHLNNLSIQEGAVEGARAAVNGKFIAVSIFIKLLSKFRSVNLQKYTMFVRKLFFKI